MKLSKLLAILTVLALVLSACGAIPSVQAPTAPGYTDAVEVVLRDDGITADGKPVGTDASAGIYVANDIVYYESGKDFTYGEGSEIDAHTADEAAAHTVVHITQPGTYSLSGKLSLGQIAVDLGDGAKKDPQAVVTLVLNGADITCQVAPAVIFYNVYECGNEDIQQATKDADTSAAGANVIIADGSVNTINGSYVARIYKPDSVILNADKTKVEDADKLHKYDGAFYSKQSMNIYGGKQNTGILNINAENEGLDSELHLTINGGNINIKSGNDGINTNEDGVSVTTVNGGMLNIQVSGKTGEGDGIDSNGWLVINGGKVIAAACSNSADAGIDSDMGIHITGGTVIATGHMLDQIEDGGQTFAVFSFAQQQAGGETVTLKNKNGKTVLEARPENAYSVLIFSSADLTPGSYTLWSNGQQLAGQSGSIMGSPGKGPDGMNPSQIPGAMEPPEGQKPHDAFTLPEDQEPPEGFTPPEGYEPPDGFTFPEGENPPETPGGNRPQFPGANNQTPQELTADFAILDGGNFFSGISNLNEPSR